MRRIHYIFAVDLLLVVLSAAGVYRVAQKAIFPVGVEDRAGGIVIVVETDSHYAQLHRGDTIVSVGGNKVVNTDEIEFLCNALHIGDSVAAVVAHAGTPLQFTAVLGRYYSVRYLLIQAVTGAIFLIMGLFVLAKKSGDAASMIFHHLCAAIALTILLTTGCFSIVPAGAGLALEVVFFAVYLLTPALFVHFTLVFPRGSFPHARRILGPLYGVAIALFIWSSAAFLRATIPVLNLEYYSSYAVSSDAVHIFFGLMFFAGLGAVIHSYHASPAEAERRKLRLILFGIATGVLEYIVLWHIPQLIYGKGIVDEDVVIALTAISPITFAVAIVRYQLFNIDRFIKRSTIYTVALGVLLVFYLSIVAFLTDKLHVYGNLDTPLVVVLALTIAVLFEPVRRRVQKVVDGQFFRSGYDLQSAQKEFREEAKAAPTPEKLAAVVVAHTNDIVPVARIGFFVVNPPNDRLHLIAHRGFDILETHGVRLEKKQLKTELDLPVGVRNMIEPGVRCEAADEHVFARWGMALALPMHSGGRELLGFLVLGEKRSGKVFSAEDIMLFESVSAQAGLALERMGLERRLALEQAESERLDELNRLKSYFVSSVSHDLKTPLTSIRLFAELLQTTDSLPRAKVIEFLSIIEGESDRLSRLITNVLDFAQIEKGTKKYTFAPLELNSAVRDTLRALDYQLHASGFDVRTTMWREPLPILGDADAIAGAITNLLTNAMKYSPAQRKHIVVATLRDGHYAIVSVQDEGHGIAPEDVERIFDAYYRLDNPATKSVGGAGIGLSVVKRTMEAHNGSIVVQSVPGTGSVFSLSFPVLS